MTKWKFQKAKDVQEEINYIGYVKYIRNIVQEFYVPEAYLKEGKVNDISPPKRS